MSLIRISTVALFIISIFIALAGFASLGTDGIDPYEDATQGGNF